MLNSCNLGLHLLLNSLTLSADVIYGCSSLPLHPWPDARPRRLTSCSFIEHRRRYVSRVMKGNIAEILLMPVFPKQKPFPGKNLRHQMCKYGWSSLRWVTRTVDASTDTSSSKCAMGIDSRRSLSTIFNHLRVHFLPSELGSRTATMRSRFPP